MLAASDPQLFTPFGRKQIERHVGSSSSVPPSLDYLSYHGGSSVLAGTNAPDECNDDDDDAAIFEAYDMSSHLQRDEDSWIVRETSSNTEEELYIKGKTVIWSRGNFGLSLADFDQQGSAGRCLVRAYTCKYKIEQALWCSFAYDSGNEYRGDIDDYDEESEDDSLHERPKKTNRDRHLRRGRDRRRREHDVESTARSAEKEAVCVLHEKQLSIYTVNSEEYFTKLHFKVSSIWATNYGLIIQPYSNKWNAAAAATSTASSFSSNFSDINLIPTLYALTHPLNEMTPFLIVKQGGILSFMREPTMKLVFVSEKPSICMTYDYRTGVHTVWKIRPSTEEERQRMNVNNGSESDSVISSTKRFSNSSYIGSIGNSFTPFDFNNRSRASGTNFSSSPLASGSGIGTRTNNHHLNVSFGKLQSSLSNTLGNSTNFTPQSNVSSRNLQFNRTTSTRFSGSPKHSPIVDARLGNSQSVLPLRTPRPLDLDLCLEYMWTETFIGRREKESSAATSVFISRDFVRQKHLCYLVPSSSSLYCAKLDKTNENEPALVFGSTSIIAAKDAAYLPSVNMIIVLEPSGNVALYSGTSLIGQVLFGSVSSSSQYLATSYYNASGQNAPQISIVSPPVAKPPRSSLLSSTRVGEDLFDVPFHQISPVKKNIVFDDGHSDDSPNDSSVVYVRSIKDTMGARATLKYSNGCYYRVSFPVVSSSFLVKKCLETLVVVLPREIASNFVITWYRSRNAPGTQDISSENEWKLFLTVLFRSLGYNVNGVSLLQSLNTSQPEIPAVAKKKKACDIGNDYDWEYVMDSFYHRENIVGIRDLLKLKRNDDRTLSTRTFERSQLDEMSANNILHRHIRSIFIALHLLYEEFKLNTMRYDSLNTLAQLLAQLAYDLNLEYFLNFYWRNHPQTIARPKLSGNDRNEKEKPLPPPPSNFEECLQKPADIFEQAFRIMRRESVHPYPFINRVNNASHDILQLLSLIFNETNDENGSVRYADVIKYVNFVGSRNARKDSLINQYYAFPNDYKRIERIVMLMTRAGYRQDTLQNLPVGIVWPLIDAIHQCRECPREDWSAGEYDLLVREDLSCQVRKLPSSRRTIDRNTIKTAVSLTTSSQASGAGGYWNETKSVEPNDGMEDMDEQLMKLLWPRDRRIHQVRKMLQSCSPAIIDIQHRADVTAHEYAEEQEKHLFGICTRTMALPIGRGMFTLHTVTPSITEPLTIPKLCLVGKSASTGTSIDFSHIEVVANMNVWPLFHNGVAAGLRISPTATVDSTWILFNKPKGVSDAVPEHAGFLMALGLNGHLKNLTRMYTFDYLRRNDEMTNVALLIGLSATHRGTMDTATTKLLSLHVECLLPPTSLELDIYQNTQIAALLGIGLVYQKSAHRHIAEILLSEMGRPPGPEMENCVDRESYTLAAGLALGLVLLEKGSNLCGLTDLNIADTLHYYMVGGHKRPLSGPQREKYKSPSYQIREGDIVNVDVTSPGATLALGLMFFNTGNKAVADWMRAPDTRFILDVICPDFILLRTLARSLILWEDIIPTVEWVESHIPDSIRPYCLVKPKADSIPASVDLETINQAYCNIVTGACFAIGLRFAGSMNNSAFETVRHYCKLFVKLFGKSISELAGKSTIENCLNVSLISLSLIMAGTGNLEVLRLCRCLRSRICQASNTVVTYGSHLATHMALGLLFFGGGRYTLSTSAESVAALIIAFYPKFPTHSNDNRYHLQAFRHLYVLAAESRLLIPRDIDTGRAVYANLTVHFADSKYYKNQRVKLVAPCLIPELKYLNQIEIKDDRFWLTVFKRGKNWNQLKSILRNSTFVDIKQRSGFTAYGDELFKTSASMVQTEDTAETNGFFALGTTFRNANDCLPWSADVDRMRKYTSDPCILKIIESFFDDETNDEETSCGAPDEINFDGIFKRIVYECVAQDKLYFLSFWISILKILRNIRQFPNGYYLWQIKLFCQKVLYSYFNNELSTSSRILTSVELGIVVKHYLFKHLEYCEKKYGISLQSCFEETDDTRADKTNVEQIKCAILSVYDVPVSFKPHSPLQGASPVEIYTSLKKQLSVQAVKKLCETESSRKII